MSAGIWGKVACGQACFRRPACRYAPRFSGRNHARPLAHYAPLVLGSSAHPRCARISRSTEELATNRQCGAPQADGGGPVPPSPSAFVAPRARAQPLFYLMINRIPYFRRPIDIPALGPLPQRCISMGRRIGIYIIIKILMARCALGVRPAVPLLAALRFGDALRPPLFFVHIGPKQPYPRPFPRPRAWSSSPLCSYVAWGETAQTARPAPSRSRRGLLYHSAPPRSQSPPPPPLRCPLPLPEGA